MGSLLDFLRAPSPRWLQPFEDAVRSLLSFLGGIVTKLFQAEADIGDNIRTISTNLQALIKNTEIEVQRVKDFKFDPHWKQRVINVPIAIEQIQTLVHKFTDGWKERIKTLQDPIHQFELIFKQEAAPDPLGDRPSQLAKSAVKLDEIATMIAQLAKASSTIIEVTSLFDELLQQIQHLDALFLKQGNPRMRLPAGGKRPFQRVGKLHSR